MCGPSRVPFHVSELFGPETRASNSKTREKLNVSAQPLKIGRKAE